MITVKIDFTCRLCNKKTDMYCMPRKIKKGNSFVHSKTEYDLVCKKCGKTYILGINIKVV